MPLIILGLFIAVPLIEIGVFIQVGGLIGLWPTLAIVFITAIAGTALLKQQGLATLRRAQASLDRGEMPLREVFDGACLLFAGALLLTPGFVTDAIGLLLFLPPFRDALRRMIVPALMKRGTLHMQRTRGGFHGGYQGGFGGGPHGPRPGPGPGGPTDIEGEYREVDPASERSPERHPEIEEPPGPAPDDDDLPPRPGPPRQ